MADKLDELLKSLPGPRLDHPLDQLEPRVWARIEAARSVGLAALGLPRFQLVAAGMALAIGLALGWTMSDVHRQRDAQTLVFANYVAAGPLARLGAGL